MLAMSNDFQLMSATVQGSEHKRLWRNCQDTATVATYSLGDKVYLSGVVCDGCSGGEHNEVGAQLTASFITREIPLLLSANPDIRNLADPLFTRVTNYLRGVANLSSYSPEHLFEFVTNYLLSTVLGFVISDEGCLIYTSGDGAVWINDEIGVIVRDNEPEYPALCAINSAIMPNRSRVPSGFSQTLIPVSELEFVAVCTDGIAEPSAPNVMTDIERLVLPEVQEEVRRCRDSRSLGRTLRRLSLRGNHFGDDCSLAACTRKSEKSEKEVA